MMKNEFEEIIGKQVSDSEYAIIEKVYTWHPAIKDTTGKQQIATLYETGGIALIREMVEAADIAKNLDAEMRKIQAQLEKVKERQERITSGDYKYENCRKELQAAFAASDGVGQLEMMIKPMEEKYDVSLILEARDDLKI